MSKVDLDLIQKLRDRTGVGMMDCKKALIETAGDIEKAVDILRKKGAAIADKRSGNATKEGLIHSYIHAGSKLGVLVEIACETDFVARTDDMKRFAHDVAMHIAASNPRFISADDVDQAFIAKEREIFRDQLAQSGKPAQIIEQIVEGKVNKVLTEVCLLQQPFIKNDQITIGGLLQEVIAKMGESIKIKRFCRFELGK